MQNDLFAKIALSKEDIIHLYHGGVLSVKIRGKSVDASLEIYCDEISEKRSTRIRFKTIDVN